MAVPFTTVPPIKASVERNPNIYFDRVVSMKLKVDTVVPVKFAARRYGVRTETVLIKVMPEPPKGVPPQTPFKSKRRVVIDV